MSTKDKLSDEEKRCDRDTKDIRSSRKTREIHLYNDLRFDLDQFDDH